MVRTAVESTRLYELVRVQRIYSARWCFGSPSPLSTQKHLALKRFKMSKCFASRHGSTRLRVRTEVYQI